MKEGASLASRVSRALRFAVIVALLAGAASAAAALHPQRAEAAAAPRIVTVANGQTGVSCALGSITIQFSNNVAAGRVFSSNASHISMVDEAGTTVAGAGSVYRQYYGDGAPDAANPDVSGLRRCLYLAVPTLTPGTTYTVVVTAGVVSLGGESFGAASATFTTEGEKPAEPEPEPDPDPEPEPVEPPPSGDGGSGGSGGDASAGSSGGDAPMPGEASDGADAASAAAGESAVAESADPVRQDAVEAQQPQDSTEVQGDGASSASLAAGQGGGSLYILGELGAAPGTPQDDEGSLQRIALVSVFFIAIALVGSAVRIGRWSRGTRRVGGGEASPDGGMARSVRAG